MTIEVLYFDGCPNHEQLIERLPRLLEQAGVAPQPELTLRRIETAEEAERERFLGSPTVRVDGRDIEPCAERRTDYGLKCRLYQTSQDRSGQPPDALIVGAIAQSV